MSNQSDAATAKLQIQSLQVFRGFAALAVVAHHAVLSTEAFVGKLPDMLARVLGMGYLGVDFFFVLSGFIIMYAHMGDDSTLSAVRRYSFKRLVRVFPAYLPISIALIVLYAWLPGFSASADRGYSLLSSLLLIPADGPPVLSVAWTLVHELMFYAVFLLYFLGKRWLVAGLLAWAVLIVFSQQVQSPASWLRYPLSALNMEFMLGVLAAWVVRIWTLRFRPGTGWWLFVVAGILVACVGLLLIRNDATSYAPRLAFALGLGLLIVGSAIREQATALHWPSILLVMGNASYSIYLVHNPLLSLTQRLVARMGLAWGGDCYSASSALYWSGMCITLGWSDRQYVSFRIIQRLNRLCADLRDFCRISWQDWVAWRPLPPGWPRPLRTVVRMTRALGLMRRLVLRWGTGVCPLWIYRPPGTSPWPLAAGGMSWPSMARYTTTLRCGQSF